MKEKLLLSVEGLKQLSAARAVLLVDCRFDFSDTNKGRRDWLVGHIPGAVYAHLDNELSSPITPASGRHPLPDTGDFAKFLSKSGWTPDSLLVAYDERSNIISARLWWLMRYYGLQAALLDGGFAAWCAAGEPVEAGEVQVNPTAVPNLEPRGQSTVSVKEVEENLQTHRSLIVDARAPERFTGAVEPLDTKAGHIPGSANWPFMKSLDSDGCFRSPEQLRAMAGSIIGERQPGEVIHSCGSGVTACHNLFAMELAGLSGSKIYPGSWSEWIRDDNRPVAKG